MIEKPHDLTETQFDAYEFLQWRTKNARGKCCEEGYFFPKELHHSISTMKVLERIGLVVSKEIEFNKNKLRLAFVIAKEQ